LAARAKRALLEYALLRSHGDEEKAPPMQKASPLSDCQFFGEVNLAG
jgi:hypothetical protein